MIDEAAIIHGTYVWVGLSPETPAVVLAAVKRHDGRVFVRARLYRTNVECDYPRSVVRLMTPSERARLGRYKPVDGVEDLPKKRQVKTRARREAEKAARPPVRSRAVSIYDIAKAAGIADADVTAAMKKHGVGK